MRGTIPILLPAFLAAPALANIYPMPGAETPRIQSVNYIEAEPVVLTALPETALTVMLEPGESIRRVTIGDDRAWNVHVSAELDGFTVWPRTNASPTFLSVETGNRKYEFELHTGTGLLAAYLVRFKFEEPLAEFEPSDADSENEGNRWSYRLRGDRSVRPATISDNGNKTTITYAQGQALPAVFAIGPSGDEEVVDGYMRDGKFVIDRIHEKLVFRIDKEKATARRNAQMDETS